ncbi:MAG TPA: class I SAM-dependent methyltransferase [Burkholderiales bacterium]|nr:class I SAM-dependent methyltransferase [Burkholderiales bacterium]
MEAPSSINRQLQHNAAAHDRVAREYNAKHSEIYNPIEQARLAAVIEDLLRACDARPPRVLDFGAGTGNLSLQFSARGCDVVAADVSAKSLDILAGRSTGTPISTAVLDGPDLPFPDASFDIVATYSVLHHVPDYLHAVAEMARVLRPGGLMYIDHETSDDAWTPSAALARYRRKTRLTPAAHLAHLLRTGELFTFAFAKTALMKAFVDRRYEREGDLHVWPDDHIQWSDIEDTAGRHGLEVIRRHDYLLYRPRGGVALYREHENACNDTRYIIARKAVR